jgi:hypothetical protein
MANRQVNITATNGALGQLAPSEDGVFGLILQSAVAPSGLALLTPTSIASLADATALGIDAAFDTANSVKCYKVIKEFYDESPSGTPLWIMFTAQTVTMTVAFDVANEATYFGKLQAASGGKCRIMSMVRSFAAGYTATTTDGVDADVLTAMQKAQALVEEFRTRKMPFLCIVPGHHYQANTTSLKDLSTYTYRWVQGFIGDTASGTGCAIGLILGRLAKIAVVTQPGKTKDGAIAATPMYHNTTAVTLALDSAVRAVENKGWLTIGMYSGKSGLYFTNDWTATSRTDDFDRLARGRIYQKAERITYQVFLDEILNDISLDTATGRMSVVAAKDYEGKIQRALDESLAAVGQVSGLTARVDPMQNVLTTGYVKVEIGLVPNAYANSFEIKLGFIPKI